MTLPASPVTSDPVRPADHATASWLAVRALPEYASKARRFAASTVDGTPHDPYDIGLLTSEVVTNAIAATAALGPWPYDLYPIGVDLAVTDRYVHLTVTDPDRSPLPAFDPKRLPAEEDDEHGRGLFIADRHAAARWVTYAETGKTVHVVVAAPGVTLTAAELEEIGAPA
ncbi:ATP-binding protein [Actinoallomurus purpureus]|uniref:ATP-binding protein n=1 Tax=Actinoallomurus purpureus TaxID=478114 RepID=UPI002093851E|nr:ATP-binding protein [Actinoallomurus purpureus]MCO6007077.1 ATP-binding protein [Actinoallomurus purpureus]